MCKTIVVPGGVNWDLTAEVLAEKLKLREQGIPIEEHPEIAVAINHTVDPPKNRASCSDEAP